MALTKIRFPETEQLGDVTKIDGTKIKPVDIICSGSPCQSFSIAGKRDGMQGESGLFRDFVRIVEQMKKATNGQYPKWVIWENVPGAFSSTDGKDIVEVLESFDRLGYVLDMNVFDAQYMGVPQRRKRIFLVADFAKTGRCAGKILLEPTCLPGNITQGQTKEKDIAKTTKISTGSAKWGGIYDVRISSDGTVNHRAHCYKTELCRSLDTHAPDPNTNHGGPAIIYDMTHADDVVRESKGKTFTLNARMGTGGNQIPILTENIPNVAMSTMGGQSAYAIGNGQTAQLKMQDMVGTLNCMHDQIAVMQKLATENKQLEVCAPMMDEDSTDKT